MKLSNTELDLLPSSQFDGLIDVVDNQGSYERAIRALERESILGFDTETRPVFKRGMSASVALLQMSTNDVTWLFRLNMIGLPVELANVLANPKIMKVGLAIRDDLRGLCRRRSFTPANCVDVQAMARELGIEEQSLKKMAAQVLGVKVSKRQRLTNWENETLTKAQCLYAATDSWISLKLYEALSKGCTIHERLIRVREAIADGTESSLRWELEGNPLELLAKKFGKQ